MLFDVRAWKIRWHGGHPICYLVDVGFFKGIWIKGIKYIYSNQLGLCPSTLSAAEATLWLACTQWPGGIL